MVGCWTSWMWRYAGQCHFGCSFLLFSSHLCTFLLLSISAQYKWRLHRYIPPPETKEVEVHGPCAPDPPNGCHIVPLCCETKGFVHLGSLNGCLIDSFHTLVYGYTALMVCTWRGDTVTAQLHDTCPGMDYTSCIFSTRHKPLISSNNLPITTLYYSTLLTLTLAIASTHIPS